jgi:hypothetical protein
MTRLPDGLTAAIIRDAVVIVEMKANLVPELYEVQPSVFSSAMSTFGVYALDQIGPYRRLVATKYPDLAMNGIGLESKASTREWAVQSHYNHAGWYVIWRYSVREGVAKVFRVDVVLLEERHWRYEPSTAREGKGGRTHTFRVLRPAVVLRHATIYPERNQLF